MNAGVSQGPILSPLLFSLMLSSLAICKDVPQLLYADELSIFVV